jgi:hypothetical protein
MSTTEQTPSTGFALLIKTPRVERRFVPLQGDTIRILDKNGKELWSVKVPAPINNPGIILHEVELNLLTARDFVQFCQKTWTRNDSTQPASPPPSTNNPS